MTNQEALDRLQTIRDMIEWEMERYKTAYDDQDLEAIDMAMDKIREEK